MTHITLTNDELALLAEWSESHSVYPLRSLAETVGEIVAARLAERDHTLTNERARFRALAEELQSYNPGHGDFHTAGNPNTPTLVTTISCPGHEPAPVSAHEGSEQR